jgi:hypothetical protein
MFEVDMGDQRGREEDRRNSCTEVDSLFEESQAVEVDSGKRQRKKVASKISSDSLFEDRRVERKEGAKATFRGDLCVKRGVFLQFWSCPHCRRKYLLLRLQSRGNIWPSVTSPAVAVL